MNKKTKINKKLKQLGQPFGLETTDIKRAKRTTKNILTMALFAAVFFVIGNIMMPGGPAGLYYTGASIKDFQIIFGGFI